MVTKEIKVIHICYMDSRLNIKLNTTIEESKRRSTFEQLGSTKWYEESKTIRYGINILCTYQ